jgi:hypothetical protein
MSRASEFISMIAVVRIIGKKISLFLQICNDCNGLTTSPA